MLVLGLGIGLSMQVLTIIVQNTSRYEDRGVATSAVTFFRTMGSSVGTAVFGALYADALAARVPAAVAASGLPATATSTPEALRAQPASKITGILVAYSDTLHLVFLYAVPVAGAAFIVSLLPKQVPMRGRSQDSPADMGDGFGMPDPSTSLQQLETALGRLLRREGRTQLPRLRAASGSELGVSDGWCVTQIRVRRELGMPSSLEAIAQKVRVPADVLRPAFAAAMAAGYVTGTIDDLELAALGTRESDKMITAVKAWIVERLGAEGTVGADDPERLDQAFEHLAREAFATDVTPAAELAAPAHQPQ